MEVKKNENSEIKYKTINQRKVNKIKYYLIEKNGYHNLIFIYVILLKPIIAILENNFTT